MPSGTKAGFAIIVTVALSPSQIGAAIILLAVRSGVATIVKVELGLVTLIAVQVVTVLETEVSVSVDSPLANKPAGSVKLPVPPVITTPVAVSFVAVIAPAMSYIKS